MTPRPYDAPGRYLVPSRSKPGEVHLVDLVSYRRNGRCSCRDFSVRKEPRLRAGEEPSNSLRCKHIHSARDAFIELILSELETAKP